ncbi:hypothetical protein AcV7_009491 [Taiwanofungus camphoratus]|nr:hypothetical protein AcV7_009491 [Antrodia cinnamomea]
MHSPALEREDFTETCAVDACFNRGSPVSHRSPMDRRTVMHQKGRTTSGGHKLPASLDVTVRPTCTLHLPRRDSHSTGIPSRAILSTSAIMLVLLYRK